MNLCNCPACQVWGENGLSGNHYCEHGSMATVEASQPHLRRDVMQMTIELKRVYDPASDSDGYRILVDRLWPRGLTEASARVDLWLRRIAPTTELRKWYSHDVEKWTEFQRRYEERARWAW